MSALLFNAPLILKGRYHTLSHALPILRTCLCELVRVGF